MARPKGSKNKAAAEPQEQAEVVKESPVEVATETAEPVETKKAVKKEDPFVLAKTSNRGIVSKANALKFEVVHISGYGSVHSPKVFYLKVQLDKLGEVLTDDEKKEIEPAAEIEIQARIKESRVRGIQEEKESGAKRRKLNAEIDISAVY